jgi:arginine/lysine/ornithine decarboxylase
MKTPISDFVSKYSQSDPLRLHMPGHKGKKILGPEPFDITEISGADVLYSEAGILAESQKNASALFGSASTFFSTEGSSLCIRAMLFLAKKISVSKGKKPCIAATRNVHKSFLSACALLDLDPLWIPFNRETNLYSSPLLAEEIEAFFKSQSELPTAIWITSPDYLGQMADMEAIAEICHKYGVLLLVDNAHGSYLNFFPESSHPLALGADLVCDSAHKTLPVLTGGAYLHLSKNLPESFSSEAKLALELFASTSPSYLILQSLDLANRYLSENYSNRLNAFAAKLHDLKKELRANGFSLVGNEPLKISIQTKPFGYFGTEIAKLLENQNIYAEHSDSDYIVFMFTPEIEENELEKFRAALLSIPQKDPIFSFPPAIKQGIKKLSPKKALFSPSKKLPIKECEGKILAEFGVSCPPAIPIAVLGEEISAEHIKAFEYYGIDSLSIIE